MSKIYKSKLLLHSIIFIVMFTVLHISTCVRYSLDFLFFIPLILLLSTYLLLYLLYKKYASYNLQITDKEIIVINKYIKNRIPFDECRIQEGFLVNGNNIVFLGAYGKELAKKLKKHVDLKGASGFNESLEIVKRVGYTHPVYIFLLFMVYAVSMSYYVAQTSP